jgi:dienelactone hydrolase
MKKLLLYLLLFPVIAIGQVKYSSGIYKTMPWAYWDNPETNNLVVVSQGSGEFVQDLGGIYSATGVLSRNSYARNAMVTQYPFDILVAGSYRAPGRTGNPDQSGAMLYLSEFISTLDHGKVVLTGYSYGGQFSAGMRTNSRNGDKPTMYMGSEIFDAYVIMCGKAPGTQDWNANKDKPMMIVHGTLDSAVPISNGMNIMNKHNATVPRYIIQSDYKQVWYGGSATWQKTTVPDTLNTKFVVIVGGGHSSAWTYGYDWREGNEVRKFIEWVFRDEYKPIECTAILDERAMKAVFSLPDGTKVEYNLVKP